MSTTAQHDASQTPDATPKATPTIIGIYGVSGCGKSYLATQLKTKLAGTFLFFEGSDELAKRVPGGLEEFKRMPSQAQDFFRANTIEAIRDECASTKKTGIITGHYMFCNKPTDPSSGAKEFQVAMTEADKKAYTHILYLKTSPETIAQQIANDSYRQRTHFDTATIREWQTMEELGLRSMCRDNNILFMTIQQDALDQTVKWIQDTVGHDEAANSALVDNILDNLLQKRLLKDVKTMLVLDADHTIAPYDASSLYWQLSGDENPLKALFKSPLGYSHTAFRQMTWLYEEHASSDDDRFDNLCEQAASDINVHPQMLNLLRKTCADKTIGVVVVTSGIRKVWEKVLADLDLYDAIPIIGSGRLSDGYVVTPKTKSDIVARLQKHHNLFVCAIGDSEVDLPMLKQANKALLVVGAEANRSKSLDPKLQDAIDNDGLRIRQILLPCEVTPRLDTKKIPAVELDESFFAQLKEHRLLRVYDATEKPAAKLLASSTRDASIRGISLQTAHENAGWYLGMEYASLILGLEAYEMQSVQDKPIQGHRVLNEQKTCIIPFMRGGDPFARGIHKAFPTAVYQHAKEPEDLEPRHVAGMTTLILADWVINTGDSMVKFVRHIRTKLKSQIPILMIAGVVQEEVVGEGGMGGLLEKELAGMGEVTLIALRISKNKYKGVGGTDTGHRLFNTTHLD